MSLNHPVVLGDPTAGRKRKKKSKKCKLNSKAKGCRKSSRVAGRDVIGKKATVVNVRVGDSGGGSRKTSAPPIAAPTFVTFAPPPQAPPAPVMEAPRPQPAPIQNHYHYPPAERNEVAAERNEVAAERNEVAAPQEVAVPRQSQQPVRGAADSATLHATMQSAPPVVAAVSQQPYHTRLPMARDTPERKASGTPVAQRRNTRLAVSDLQRLPVSSEKGAQNPAVAREQSVNYAQQIANASKPGRRAPPGTPPQMHQSLHPVHRANISLKEENRALAKRHETLVSEQRAHNLAQRKSALKSDIRESGLRRSVKRYEDRDEQQAATAKADAASARREAENKRDTLAMSRGRQRLRSQAPPNSRSSPALVTADLRDMAPSRPREQRRVFAFAD